MGRDLLAWAFASPRRLLLVVLAPLLVAGLMSVLLSRLNAGEGPLGAPVARATEGATTSGTVTPRPDQLVTPATVAPAAVTVVNRFVQLWLTGPTTTPAQTWHKRLAPYVTPELAAALRNTDPGRVPDTTIAGSPQAIRIGDYLSQVSVPMTDGNDLTVTVTWDGEVWRVSDIEREDGP